MSMPREVELEPQQNLGPSRRARVGLLLFELEYRGKFDRGLPEVIAFGCL